MRVGGAVAVVVIHVTSPAVVEFGKIPRLDWWVSLFAYTACRWAVPLFIMLSGALLLDPARQESAGRFYRRRLWRVGVPTLFWSAFYLGWRAWVQGKPTDGEFILNALAIGAPYPHLYFLFLLLGLYVVTPSLRLFLAGASRPQQLLAVLLAFGVGMGDKFVRSRFGGGVNVFWMFVPYLGFYLAGGWLRGVVWTPRQARGAGWVWVVSLLASLVLTRLFLNQREHLGLRLWPTEYLSPPIVAMTLATFVWLDHRCRNLTPRPALTRLGELMLGIYLVHPALLNLLRDAGLTGIWHSAFVGIPVSCALALLGAGLLCVGLRAIPGLRAVIGG